MIAYGRLTDPRVVPIRGLVPIRLYGDRLVCTVHEHLAEASTTNVPTMRHLLICLFLFSVPAAAAKVGLGASVKDGDSSIYVPIDISPRFRIEPYVRQYGYDSSIGPVGSVARDPGFGTSLGTISLSSSSTVDNYDSLSLGTGVFGLTRLADNAAIYYGARVAYVESESTTRSDLTDPVGLFRPVRPVSVDIVRVSDGYAITPLAGLEYYPVERFSIAVEIGWEFSRTEDFHSVTGRPDSRSVLEATRTRASVIVRIYF